MLITLSIIILVLLFLWFHRNFIFFDSLPADCETTFNNIFKNTAEYSNSKKQLSQKYPSELLFKKCFQIYSLWEKCKGTRFKIRATYIKWKISKLTSLQYRKKKSEIRARLSIVPGSLSFSPFLEGLLQTSTDKNFFSYIRQSAWLKIYCPHFPRICTLTV